MSSDINKDKQKLSEHANNIYTILESIYPDARCTLNFSDPLELLIATILSAQCTDERVNKVTERLFKKYRTINDYIITPIDSLEQDIMATGFYKNKAKSIKKCCEQIVKLYNGEVPNNMDDLTTLSGVGRKTANVILGNYYNIPSIVVDTHVKRVSKRVGITEEQDPEKIELDLMELLPKERWIHLSHLLIFHGRRHCKAKIPLCHSCKLLEICPTGERYIH